MQTLAVRLDRLEQNAMRVATWLKSRPEVELVLHPAFADCPGHALWKRDFSGSSSIFSVVLRPEWTPARIAGWMESLALFQMGFSWGGVASLIMAYPKLSRLPEGRGPRLVRLNVGLEEAEDLIADLEQAFNRA
jgi:cystathionine beta-lyase